MSLQWPPRDVKSMTRSPDSNGLFPREESHCEKRMCKMTSNVTHPGGKTDR